MANNQIQCLISDSRACKASALTEEVFIIGSGNDEFKLDIAAIKEVLAGFGFPGIFALLSDEYKGLDAFCDKICSKIREAQFCIVMLNDPYSSQFNTLRVPSANVYYEFGMAVAQGKSVIPIIKRGLSLPFDVQHLDVVIYDNIEDLKVKLKTPIVSTLRKQKAPIVDNNDELKKQVYGPLYNEVDRFLTRKDKFTEFNRHNYSQVISLYKYLLDKTAPEFQKRIARFYSEIDSFNRQLGVAQKAITKIVQGEFKKRFKDQQGRPSRVEVAITNDCGQTSLPTFEQILIRKLTPKSWYNAFDSAQKVISVNYTLKTDYYKDHKLNLARGDFVFASCQAKVEKDPEVIKIRKMDRTLNMVGKELLDMLKRNC